MYSVVSKKIRYGGFEYGRWNYSCDFSGVAGIVNLKKGELTVSYEQDVEDAVIIERLEKRGYLVTEVLIAEKKDNG